MMKTAKIGIAVLLVLALLGAALGWWLTREKPVSVQVAGKASRTLVIETYQENMCGVIHMEKHYGAPNYGENPESDALETVARLHLDEPVYVLESASPDMRLNERLYVEDVQILPQAKVSKDVGKRVCLSGEFFQRITGHHFYPTLLFLDAPKPGGPPIDSGKN